jgi:hypothetical protein
MSEKDETPKPLTGQAADDFWEETKRLELERRAQDLAREKEDARRRGKEPFDLERLEKLFGGEITTEDYNHIPLEERRADLEFSYYVSWPSYMTLEEFAAHLHRVLQG